MTPNEPASTGQTSYLAGPDGRIGYDVSVPSPAWSRPHERNTAMNNATDPIRRVSLVSTGQVQIHPDHEAATWRPIAMWLLTSRRWTAPRPINAYVIEHRDGLVLFDTGQDRDLPGLRWHRITPEATGDPALAPFRSGHDLFGDSSLVLLPTRAAAHSC
jgi:hypothetical protein